MDNLSVNLKIYQTFLIFFQETESGYSNNYAANCETLILFTHLCMQINYKKNIALFFCQFYISEHFAALINVIGFEVKLLHLPR